MTKGKEAVLPQNQGTFAARLKKLGSQIWKHRAVYTLLLPGLVWYFIFAYMPMGGLSLAFKSYKANLGIWASPWVGFENYRYVFRDPAFWGSIQRTLIINLGRLVFQFPAPVLIALMLNEVRVGRYKKVLQSLYTFPHFLSWVIVASIMTNLLSYDGIVNGLLGQMGSSVNFLGNAKIFQPMLYITEIWKSSGYSAIIYLAAISGIDVDQYEAAEIDGASRMQRIFRITLPNILPTITIMFILMTGNLMSTGFDQIFNLSNAAVKEVSETLDMYIYRITFQSSSDFSFSTAVSLFRSLINMILLVLADRGSRLMGGNGLFG
ncbi:ABC transporter permease subunit [Ruminococcaceae bacterium OttesenSCG-928-L11]|nr:ABC transporter permease subunit [Ruminococcaceae bacterium OttesenSCG-928-L11]